MGHCVLQGNTELRLAPPQSTYAISVTRTKPWVMNIGANRPVPRCNDETTNRVRVLEFGCTSDTYYSHL